jgi:isochorismate synthase
MATIKELVHYYIQQKTPFALYRFPESDKIHLIAQPSNATTAIAAEKDFTQQKGFVFAPFVNGKYPTLFINAEKEFTFQNFDESVELSDKLNAETISEVSENNYTPTTKEEYITNVARSIETIKCGTLEKVVISGVSIKEVATDFNVMNYYENLCKQYPNVLVYLFFSIESGLWVGATPELLLQLNDKQLKTVSLAGTKSLKNKNAETPWQRKEIDEQYLVTKHIQDCFQQHFSEPLEISETKTISTGHLLHLRTDFKLQSQNGSLQKHFFSFLKDLHPTPAVGGSAKKNAIAHILNTEKHERAYYTGYLGPVNVEGNSNLYVNLRCLKYENGKLILFSGAGITADSIPEKEWEEIQLKAETLLKLLE